MAKVYVSNVIPAAVGLVWAQVRNFNGLPDWTGFVAESRIEQNLPADKIGCIRNFRLRNGGRIRERLLALSDYEMSCTYAILESPMGVENYVATLRLIPVTDGDQTFADLSAEFDAAPDREAQIADDIARNVFGAALASLRNLFAQKRHG
jgi:Polyketide cyclase / dehydrase and lipid transport